MVDFTESGLSESGSHNPVGGLGLSEEVFTSVLCNQSGTLELKVGALNFSFIDGELSRQRGCPWQGLSRGDDLVSDLSFDLFAHLSVHGALGQLL